MYNEDEFQIMRAEALEYISNKNRKLLEEWCKEINYTKPLGFYNDIVNHTITLYVKYPGSIIGPQGKHIEILREKLKEEFSYNYNIKIEEVRGGFINLNSLNEK